jgi:hypothetical protein
MIGFEYKVVDLDTNMLNELGAEGWEAIGVVTDPQFDQYDRNVLRFNVHSVLLKRQRSDVPEGSKQA